MSCKLCKLQAKSDFSKLFDATFLFPLKIPNFLHKRESFEEKDTMPQRQFLDKH